MTPPEITIPIKCSAVKRLDATLGRIIYAETFIICVCGFVAGLWFFWCAAVGITKPMGGFDAFMLSMLCFGGMIYLGLDPIFAFYESLPTISCIKDDERGDA